ncbi:ExbD/TolR family protein [Oceaniglobus trochenteri]|uniref:ExbD/TolR family protein n=1 Tax=Oceaniglobus trochenteri TaxID=2763260 RepID=UPI001CFF8E12|nr:biopolymer transporter ExbD [Oceaniglobus trochenteri]
MKLGRPRRRTPPETIIALIDVVFFLLIFFMLVGRMDASAPFDVLPPTAQSGADMPGGGVTVSVSADGALALEGGVMARVGVLKRLAERLDGAPDTLVRLNADRGAPLRHVLPLAAEIEALGAHEVVLVLTPGLP